MLVGGAGVTVTPMTMKVELGELAERLGEYTFAYLVTVGDEGRAHLLAVLPELGGDALTIGGVGKHSLANVATHPTATLVWPPASAGRLQPDRRRLGGAGDGDGEIVVTPTKAILHRPAVDTAGQRTGSDCAARRRPPLTTGVPTCPRALRFWVSTVSKSRRRRPDRGVRLGHPDCGAAGGRPIRCARSSGAAPSR